MVNITPTWNLHVSIVIVRILACRCCISLKAPLFLSTSVTVASCRVLILHTEVIIVLFYTIKFKSVESHKKAWLNIL